MYIYVYIYIYIYIYILLTYKYITYILIYEYVSGFGCMGVCVYTVYYGMVHGTFYILFNLFCIFIKMNIM